jgi:cytochrome c-type biogenesis protein CcmH/NrfF
LVSQQVLWGLLPQAFFIGAFVGLLNAPSEPKNALFGEEQTLLLWLLPTAAFLTGLLAYVGIVSSLKSIAHLRHLYEGHVHAKASADHSTSFIRISKDLRTFEN